MLIYPQIIFCSYNWQKKRLGKKAILEMIDSSEVYIFNQNILTDNAKYLWMKNYKWQIKSSISKVRSKKKSYLPGLRFCT